ncbi:DUF1566 domain-containing protein [Patiriisocius sp. Uisw_017]|uniref:Lcl C-terminal domain-containing protein n=1 Tax=Patiriisocius sp. Uisw_017 TaxID=3230968 RepID=UPI0039ED94BA
MKRITLACLLLFCITSFAQQGINYKALIKDGSGVIVSSTAIDVTFTILDGAVNVYEETHAPTTDANGIVILNIGEGTPVTGDFSTIDWSSNNHFLKVQIDTGGGLQDMGTTAFKTVPYAMHATTATTLPGGIDQGYIAALEARLEARIAALEPEPAVIGDIREGGVVFWVDPADNTHGLVCAFSDYLTMVEWGCYGQDLSSVPNVAWNGGNPVGLGAEIGDGEDNTSGILVGCPGAPAALAARFYGPDWFLPSINELNEIYINRATLQAVAGFNVLSISAYYWSSTEYNNFFAWKQYFNDGNQNSYDKSSTSYVRAVRAF